jgi:hypothetical protein
MYLTKTSTSFDSELPGKRNRDKEQITGHFTARERVFGLLVCLPGQNTLLTVVQRLTSCLASCADLLGKSKIQTPAARSTWQLCVLH